MELSISRLLAAGVILSSLVIIAGGALMLASYGAGAITFSNFHGQPTSIATLPAILSSALALRPEAIIQVGLVILVATPITRVALSLLLFWKKADYLYVGITGLVLAILILAISDQR
jgi:uncharacterized membrane protein